MTDIKRRRLIPYSLLLTLLPTLLLPLLFHPTPPRTPFTPLPSEDLSQSITIAIKTYVCDSVAPNLLTTLLHSIRINHPSIRVIIANDGPKPLSTHPIITNDPFTEELRLPLDVGISAGRNAIVDLTTTPFFLLLDDDHLLDPATQLSLLRHSDFDIVGLRVRNLPGIPELETSRIFLPRYIANITAFENRKLRLCVWDENAGPGVHDMKTPLKVDVLHNAFMARTHVLKRLKWRQRLKVNEHMSFFLDAWKNHVRVGYLPSVFVHHRPRIDSLCYQSMRGREQDFEKFLDYDDDFLWTKGCYDRFPEYVKSHLELEKHRAP